MTRVVIFVLLLFLCSSARAACRGHVSDGCESDFYRPSDAPTDGLDVCLACPTAATLDNENIVVSCPSSAIANFPHDALTMPLTNAIPLASSSCTRYIYRIVPRDGDDCPLEVSEDGQNVRLIRERLNLCKNQVCHLSAQIRQSPTCNAQCQVDPTLTVQIPIIDINKLAQINSPYPHDIRSCQQWHFLKYELTHRSNLVSTWSTRPTINSSSKWISVESNNPFLINVTSTRLTRHCGNTETLTSTFRIYHSQCPTVVFSDRDMTWTFEGTTGPRFRTPFNSRAPPVQLECQSDLQRMLDAPQEIINSCNEVIGTANATMRRQQRRVATECLHAGGGSFSWNWQNPNCPTETLSQFAVFVLSDRHAPSIIAPSPLPPLQQTLECAEHAEHQQHMIPDTILVNDNCLGNFSVTATKTIERTSVNKYIERRQHVITDGCNPVHILNSTRVVNNNKRPRVVGNPPAPTVTYQCTTQVPEPTKTTIDNVIGNCLGPLDQVYNDYPQRGLRDCRDDWSRRKEFIIRDQDGNELRIEQTEIVNDTIAPVLYPNSTLLTRTCFWPPTGRYACFSNISLHLNSKWERDNCGEPHTVSLADSICQAHDCNSADGSDCTQAVRDRADGQPACNYDPVKDQLCMRIERPRGNRARRYKITPTAHDMCRNPSPWELTYIVPGFGPGEEVNACEHHQWILVPTQENLQYMTPFGPIKEEMHVTRTPASSTRSNGKRGSAKSGAVQLRSLYLMVPATVTVLAMLL